ncbi:hypothetical protein ACTHQ4_15905 [Alkalicoccobacillus gibsonii]|uniref:hypothetical protein n=1 Tax=Alkalicoccobacillus gibsonii TaxID=79881 RepID=UPI003F7C75CE
MGVNVEKAEKTYTAKNGVELTYLEDPYAVKNYIGKQKLLIIFQSLGNEKAELERDRYPYTLIDGLKFYNCRKIYIKDNRELAGDYYLGSGGSFDTKDAVTEFLKSKIVEYGILRKDITTFGFSKGGYSALMFGFELGAGNIVTAIPTFNLWDRIENYKPFLKYILPERFSAADKKFYADYLKNIILNSVNIPDNIYIVTSHNDETYAEHITPLLKTLKQKGLKPHVFHNDEYAVTRHNNVVTNSLNEIFAILSVTLSDEKIKKLFV